MYLPHSKDHNSPNILRSSRSSSPSCSCSISSSPAGDKYFSACYLQRSARSSQLLKLFPDQSLRPCSNLALSTTVSASSARPSCPTRCFSVHRSPPSTDYPCSPDRPPRNQLANRLPYHLLASGTDCLYDTGEPVGQSIAGLRHRCPWNRFLQPVTAKLVRRNM